MDLSERELRILRDLEDSLQDCDRRCAAIQRRAQGRRSRRWLILLSFIAPIIGFNLILLGAITAHGGIVVALLGSAVLAFPCAWVGRLRNQCAGDPAELHEAAPGSGTVLG
jgi:hypothetical protein